MRAPAAATGQDAAPALPSYTFPAWLERGASMTSAHFALIPAAGSGARFGGDQPKQYRALRGRPLLEHTVAALARLPALECVFVVLAPGDRDYLQCRMPPGLEVVSLYCGGPSRACSVFNGLVAVRDRIGDDDWIWVHDAARPCVSAAASPAG